MIVETINRHIDRLKRIVHVEGAYAPFQFDKVNAERERGLWVSFVRLKGDPLVLGIKVRRFALSVRDRMILHGRFLSLNRLGFGYVGSASVSALVGPRRLGGASYHSTRELFSEIREDFKLRHYPKIRSAFSRGLSWAR